MKNYKKELNFKLEQIKKVFNTDKITSIEPNTVSIANYYKANRLFYTLFHNRDFIHMGITRRGKVSTKDLLEQPKLVDKYVNRLKAGRVLELATGRGASSIYLADKHPDITFDAIDLPNGQIDYAIERGEKLKNFFPREGDYHDLRYYPSKSFDIVFIIEALCHSNNKKRVFNEVKRVLKNNGVFIIFDGYSGKPTSMMNGEELLAIRLTEKCMFIPNFDYYPDFKDKLIKSGFVTIREEDTTHLIIPNLKKFERMAKFFLAYSIVTKIIYRIFPSVVANNLISAFLMITLCKLGIAKYMILVISKEAE